MRLVLGLGRWRDFGFNSSRRSFFSRSFALLGASQPHSPGRRLHKKLISVIGLSLFVLK
jgi:hypothetical protein